MSSSQAPSAPAATPPRPPARPPRRRDRDAEADAARAAAAFDPARAAATLERLWREVRLCDHAAVQRGAAALLADLQAAGIARAAIQTVPADGATTAGGWLAPVAWQVSSARLELPGDPPLVLADYAAVPHSIALYSPPTPGGDWIEGDVAVAAPGTEPATPEALAGLALRGRFLLLPPGTGSAPLDVFAAEQGVLAVLIPAPGPHPDAARYLNAAVSLAADAPCVPVFSLTPATAADLRLRLAAQPSLRLRARVQATRGTGTLPVVTGTVGGGPGVPVFVCGHMDEPGANDNASGCAVAVEALRVLQALQDDPAFPPPQRAVHFFFSAELRGLQLWLNGLPRPPSFVSGINLDMVGADSGREPCTVRVGGGFPHRPHFGVRVLNRALAVADRLAPCPCTRKPGGCVVGDSAVLGVQQLEGSVSLEQTTGPSYHTSADTPARLIAPAMLRWSGAATTAYLYLLTRLSNDRLADLADTVRDEALARLAAGTPDGRQAAARAAVELETLARAAVPPNIFNGWTTPAQLYAAGVNRRTGRWPATAAIERLRQTAADLSGALARAPVTVPGAPPLAAPAADVRREADALVPLALFRGPLAFDDQWRPAARERLLRETGLQVGGWGTENWAWRLCNCLRGRRTLAEIVDDLAVIGVGIDLERALRLTRLLVELGRVRLRPILDAAALQAALTAVGVRRGSILMAHVGLSRFGYVRGGPAAVVAALREQLGPDGTLAMPTHSGSVLGAAPYDPRTSRSHVGAVTEYFRQLPGVLRSAHPTHSVAALGPAAAELVAGHRAGAAALARDGFWGRLYDLNGDVLLLCPIRSATAFHVGETWIGLPQAPLVVHAVSSAGRRRVFTIPNAAWHVDHFEALMASPLLARGAMRQVQLGEAPLYLASARAMIDISVEVNRRDPLCSLGKQGTCGCWYCRALRENLAARGAAPPAVPHANP